MSRLEQIPSQCRSLRPRVNANQLAGLLAHAEANELFYLDFSGQIAEHDLTERTRSRIARHLKQAQLSAGNSVVLISISLRPEHKKARLIGHLLDLSCRFDLGNLLI